MLKWFIFILKVVLYKASFSCKKRCKRIPQISILKTAKLVKKGNCQIVALIGIKRFCMFTHFHAVSFSIKTCFYETSNIFYLEYCTYFRKTVSYFWKFNKNQEKVILDFFVILLTSAVICKQKLLWENVTE